MLSGNLFPISLLPNTQTGRWKVPLSYFSQTVGNRREVSLEWIDLSTAVASSFTDSDAKSTRTLELSPSDSWGKAKRLASHSFDIRRRRNYNESELWWFWFSELPRHSTLSQRTKCVLAHTSSYLPTGSNWWDCRGRSRIEIHVKFGDSRPIKPFLSYSTCLFRDRQQTNTTINSYAYLLSH